MGYGIVQKKLSIKEICWHGIIFWSVIYTAFEGPFSYTYHLKIQNWQLWFDAIISILLTVDFVYDQKSKKNTTAQQSTDITLQDQPSKTHGIYNKAFMFFSLFACLPFDVLASLSTETEYVALFQILRLIKMVRIIRIFSMLGDLRMIPGWIKMQVLVVFSLLAIHWIACGWGMIYNAKNSLDIITSHVTSMYWAVTTLTTIGYGDITPTTNGGRLFTMMVMILGVGVYGVVIANVSKIISNDDRYKERSKEKINDLSILMNHYNIPENLQNTVFNYYHHILKERLSENDGKIISDLPKPLQNELFTYMNIKLIRSIPIFKNSTMECLKDVACGLEQKFYAPATNIITSGEIGEEMYVISHGSVEIICNQGNIVATLHAGQIFGESALLNQTKRNATVRSKLYCDLYKLSKASFDKIIVKHPALYEQMKQIEDKRAA